MAAAYGVDTAVYTPMGQLVRTFAAKPTLVWLP
jgi:hypothetical protein